MFNAIEYINKPKWQVSRLGLERITKLLEMLGNPQKKLKFVHVAGTNGKGSTCAYLSQILIESGYKTGQFTSPFIYDFNERIRINNRDISNDDLTKTTLKIKDKADQFPDDDHPTEFELLTAVAFLYFYEQKCDVVVCEVGMGGRLDSTNAIDSEETILSVITPIEFDHTQFLGNTISEIAFEKAGIIKDHTPVLSAIQLDEAAKVIKKQAENLNCQLYFSDLNKLKINKIDLSEKSLHRVFTYKNYENISTSLLAIYQPANAMLAIEAALVIRDDFKNISKSSIEAGINNCRWPGRFEIVKKNPYIIIDGGHNVGGVDALIDSLLDVFGKRKFIFIMGVLADKDYKTMVNKITPFAKKVYTVTPPNERCLENDKLAKCFEINNVIAEPVDIDKAIDMAEKNSNEDDIICAFGSLYSIKDLKSWQKGQAFLS